MNMITVLEYAKKAIIIARIPAYLMVGAGAGTVASAGLKMVESTIENKNALTSVTTKVGVFALQSLVAHNATAHVDEMLMSAIDSIEKSQSIIESAD